MYRQRQIYTQQLVALLLMAVMMLVHVAKSLHTHASHSTAHHCQQENVIIKTGALNSSCAICEFQLAKDTPFTGEIELLIVPANITPIYSRLLISINADCSFITEDRGPPRA